jgi:hypothetical protein
MSPIGFNQVRAIEHGAALRPLFARIIDQGAQRLDRRIIFRRN